MRRSALFGRAPSIHDITVALTLWAVRQRTERYLAANRRLESRIAERTRGG